jgi:cystathionine beta-lyase/cystathionine gamma-synthase
VQKTAGAVPSPFDAWLALRGLKTLAIRMDRHEKNAMAIAKFLETHPNVEKVFYPGLETHQGYELAKKQMTGFGGVVSFMIKGGKDEANTLFKKLKLFQLADSLGGVESLVNYSAIMSHGSFPIDLRNKIGVTDNFIRLSVGIEHHEDLIDDLKNALD